MIVIRRGQRLSDILYNNFLSTVVTSRYASIWAKDYKSGAYPKTEEERLRAAIKYNMIPEDYKPICDEGDGLGDYPELPIISGASKDPFENYDYPNVALNYGEPIPINYDAYIPARFDYTGYVHSCIPYPTMAAMFLGFIGFWAVLYILFDDVRVPKPMKPKQYPAAGPHYTFDRYN